MCGYSSGRNPVCCVTSKKPRLSEFRHDAERADGGQRTAVVAIELVDALAVNDQFPLVAARQV
jgi:hypothetical protein